MKKCVFPNGVVPIAPYSPGVQVGNMLFISGQIGTLEDGKTLAASIEEQTRIALEKTGAVLKEVGLGYENVVSVDVLLTDMANYAAMNAVYAGVFGKNSPARAAYAVQGLPLGALVEIKSIAVKI